MIQRILTDNKIVTVQTTVTEYDRIIYFDDIVQSVEFDEHFDDAPWELGDGWDHKFKGVDCWTHEGERDSVGWVNKYGGENGHITIDNHDIINKWGIERHAGESKQVWLERVAQVKRDALDQLVKWYENGWSYYVACATYGDYRDSCGGIDCRNHAEEIACECAFNVADQMENDGYIIEGQPEPPKQYSAIDALKQKIYYNLTGTWK